MFTNLNSPSKLSGWKSSGGDPCGDSWEGIQCSGSFVTQIKLSGLGLTGSLGYQLSNLKSVTYLHLQDNKFTGTLDVLAALPLKDLNVEDNEFTGWFPDSLEGIDNLETGGNSWSSGHAPRGKSSSAHEKGGGKKGMSGLAIALLILASLVVLVLLLLLFSRKRSSPSSNFLDEEKETESLNSSGPIDKKTLQKDPSMGYKPPPSNFSQSINDNQFASCLNPGRNTSVRAVAFPLTDLQTATGNFALGRLIGEGSLGRVYRAKYPDGKVLAVKTIDLSLHQGANPEDFSEIVTSISKVHHPNIAELVGYCAEQEHNMLIYDYFRNGSLHGFLHVADDYSKPLTWNTRVRIALGTARAVE
ncbi:hypothetical protein OIU79_018797 [Salix purpurea]|uniref:Protein kinase domain-containing protein n=1 Tax=Salix purpurea TaxID=77065 RepID=A0A9Q0SID5_SALPP|nr:hypothetical protein OIU79_018797 [Salix purpurea]